MSIRVSPPSSRMPTSKETRVRVEGLSKIIARTLPASGLSVRRAAARAGGGPSWRRRRQDPPQLGGRQSAEVEKMLWRGAARSVIMQPPSGAGTAAEIRRRRPRAAGQASAISASVDDQRRQQAHDVVAGRDHQEMMRPRRGDEIGIRNDGSQGRASGLRRGFRR